MNKYINNLKKLCTPAFIYLIMSVISILLIAFQNIGGNNKKYCIGLYECNVPNTLVVFILKILYVVFWTFILNVLCNCGYKEIAWVLVLLPFVLLFVLIGLFLLNRGAKLIK